MIAALFQLPQASTFAAGVDGVFDFIFWVSVVGFVATMAAVTYFVLRYRRSRSHPDLTPHIEGHTVLETVVGAVLFLLVMVVFALGWMHYIPMRTMPDSAVEVNVLGKQWMWNFQYTNGRTLTNELVVPAGTKVKLIMNSSDVLHSFYVPDFRIKQDVVPGTYSMLWFEAPQPGEHRVFCAEYCGTAHANMMATVRVVPAQEYQRWQETWELEQRLGVSGTTSEGASAEGGAAKTPADQGRVIFAKVGCNACHSLTGQSGIGPALNNIFRKQVAFADGSSATVDENYLRNSIMEPQSKVRTGFQPIMPTYAGQLSDEDVNALVALIKSLNQ